ncbi:MAG: UDP-glucose 4-epimerase GalE [Clostridiales Family XIII bacterium]|jgi:UDP-glucose 4-epimerase|nr:UDP-glucose 4-epimerase GalE [Clostridiales Family XIII bacterium]
MNVLLTGGAGFIGSHTAIILSERGHDIVVLDNFSNSKPSVIQRIERITGRSCPCEEADLTDAEAVDAVFRRWKFDAVIHFAGFKAVGESVEKPLEYYENNLIGTLKLMEAMTNHDVGDIIFSSSATVYRGDSPAPYYEDYPLGASNPYGWTKVMIERMLRDVCAADSRWAAVLLRYFNPIGAHPSGLLGEDPNGIPNNLLPYVAKVAVGELPVVRIFGDDYDTPDGTGVRDYIHVMDLARGHLLALDYIRTRRGCFSFNLGTGKGYSVKEVVAAFERACGKPLPSRIDPRRAGDLPEIYANVDLARKELGFSAEFGLSEMCADAWNWQRRSSSASEGL